MKDNPLALDRQFCFALHAASRAMIAAHRGMLDVLEIESYPQYLVLLCLWEKDGQRVSELGERLHLDSGTLTPLLKRMERTGYVKRRPDPHDDRALHIFLASAGRCPRGSVMVLRKAVYAKTGCSLEELDKIRTTLEKITTNLIRAREAHEASDKNP